MEFTQEYILLSNTPFGDLQVRYYGIIIVTALLVGAWVASRLARRSGLDADHIWGGLTWGIIPGIIFARLWFVLFPPISLTAGCGVDGGRCQDTAWFLQNFFDLNNGAIAIWSGGLSIFGAVLGGMLGVWLYLGPWHNRVANFFYLLATPFIYVLSFIFWLPVAAFQRITGRDVTPFSVEREDSDFPDEGIAIAPWLDVAAVAIPIAQTIGRFANYVNQELYGTPTTLPWGIGIDRANRVGEYTSLVEYPAETLFHPIWAYEAIWSLGAFFVLRWLYLNKRHDLRTGDLFLIYIIQYGVIRFILEFLRIEIALIPGTDINSSQAMTGLMVVIAVLVLVYRHRPGAVEQAKAEEAAAMEADMETASAGAEL